MILREILKNVTKINFEKHRKIKDSEKCYKCYTEKRSFYNRIKKIWNVVYFYLPYMGTLGILVTL